MGAADEMIIGMWLILIGDMIVTCKLSPCSWRWLQSVPAMPRRIGRLVQVWGWITIWYSLVMSNNSHF
jgi:hypothetical protein